MQEHRDPAIAKQYSNRSFSASAYSTHHKVVTNRKFEISLFFIAEKEKLEISELGWVLTDVQGRLKIFQGRLSLPCYPLATWLNLSTVAPELMSRTGM